MELMKYVTVQIESPQSSLVSTYLEDIYTDIYSWRTLSIPAGAKIVWRGTCEGKEFKWSLQETTIPDKYLPSFVRAGKTGS